MADPGIRWQDLFVGRKAELTWLKEHWAKVIIGEPQLVVLLGESGLGKTRIAQEFYRWLSREHDASSDYRPQGYWPDAFTTDEESLAVNPSFNADASMNGDIPWLWWGLRWLDPIKRNQIDERCALSTFRGALAIHTQAIDAKRRGKEIAKKAAWQIAETCASSALPGLFLIKDLLDFGKDFREVQKLKEAVSLDREAQKREIELQLKDLFLRDFRAILDSNEKLSPTIPVILLLDDAQWADSTSLLFVRELFAESMRKKWKLMVIVTHWEQEWNKSPDLVDGIDGSIRHTRQLPRALNLPQQWRIDCVRTIHPLPEAEEIVRYAFPGLTDVQSRMVVDKSGGNTEMLREALLWLEKQPKFFIQCDRRLALSSSGEKQLIERKFKLAEFVRERFESLNVEIRRALGWSSLQGTRFLSELTQAAGNKVAQKSFIGSGPAFDDGNIAAALNKAENPHAWICFEGNSQQRNLAVFRQKVFWQIAWDDLNFDLEEKSLVETAIREVLTNWLDIGKLDNLPSAEKLDVLLIAKRVLTPVEGDSMECKSNWSRILARLVRNYRSEYLYEQATAVACEWFDARPLGGWSFDTVPFEDQFEILCLLRDRNPSRRQTFAKELTELCQKDANLTPDRNTLRNLAYALLVSGDIDRNEGDPKAARMKLTKSLSICRQIQTDYGSDRLVLLDLSRVLVNIAEIDDEEGDLKAARTSYIESLAICNQIVVDFGETFSVLSALIWTLASIGDIAFKEGDLKVARRKYAESMLICGKIMTECDSSSEVMRIVTALFDRIGNVDRSEYELKSARKSYEESLSFSRKLLAHIGPSPQSLRDLSIALEKVGDICYEEGDLESAKTNYMENLAICQRVIDDFGPTPLSLRDMGQALTKVGDINRDEGDLRAARMNYERSLAICQRLLSDVGSNPMTLQILGLSLSNLGDISRKEGDLVASKSDYENSLSIYRRILADYGPSPKTLRNLSFVLANIGDIDCERGDLTSAKLNFLDSICYCRQSMTSFGPSPFVLRDGSLLLDKIGGINREEGDLKSARRNYEASFSIYSQLLTDMGPNPQTLRDVSLALANIGDIDLDEHDLKSAKVNYTKSLSYCRQLLTKYGPSRQVLDDVFASEFMNAGIAVLESNSEEAMALLSMARARLSEIRLRGWATTNTDKGEKAVEDLEARIKQLGSQGS